MSDCRGLQDYRNAPAPGPPSTYITVTLSELNAGRATLSTVDAIMFLKSDSTACPGDRAVGVERGGERVAGVALRLDALLLCVSRQGKRFHQKRGTVRGRGTDLDLCEHWLWKVACD